MQIAVQGVQCKQCSARSAVQAVQCSAVQQCKQCSAVQSAVQCSANLCSAFDISGYRAQQNVLFVSAGKALKTVPRDQVVIASKFGAMKVNGVYQFDCSPEGCRKALEGSLKNLGVDYIDLYILRSWDHKTEIEDTIKAMAVSNPAHV